MEDTNDIFVKALYEEATRDQEYPGDYTTPKDLQEKYETMEMGIDYLACQEKSTLMTLAAELMEAAQYYGFKLGLKAAVAVRDELVKE